MQESAGLSLVPNNPCLLLTFSNRLAMCLSASYPSGSYTIESCVCVVSKHIVA